MSKEKFGEETLVGEFGDESQWGEIKKIDERIKELYSKRVALEGKMTDLVQEEDFDEEDDE